MADVQIIDTTLRDGQQSLWAYRMRADAMVPAAADLDAAGFEAVEFLMAPAQFPRAVRDLHESPWDWVHAGRRRFRTTPLRLHGGVTKRFRAVPDCIQQLFIEHLVALGITVTRTSDPWNDFEEFRWSQRTLAEYGMRTVINLIYSVSPRHTVDYYAERTRQAVAIQPYRICFKDVGGLLTPELARPVLSAVLANAGDVPVEFHTHCNNGFGPYNCLIAAELGVRHIHTATPPLADGSSLPSVFDVVPNLRARGHRVGLDLEPLYRVRDHFCRVAEREDLPQGHPAAYREDLYSHQVPGGMISNLRFQLAQIGAQDRLDEALEETSRVRTELGYPIMVTPLSQFVGSQAALNVLSGSRYENVTDEVIGYALGHWGREAPTVMDPDIKDRILSRPRAKQLMAEADRRQESPTLTQLRSQHRGMTDEELITFFYVGQAGPPARQPAEIPAAYDDYGAAPLSLAELLNAMGSMRRVHGVTINAGGTSISAGRRNR